MILIDAWLIRANEDEVVQFLDRLAIRVDGMVGLNWDYPNRHDSLLSISYDLNIDEIEEVEDISYLISKDDDLSFIIVTIRLRLSRKVRLFECVEAAQSLISELLSYFNGFACDNEGVFWDYDEIKNGTKKNGLQFLETEYSYFTL